MSPIHSNEEQVFLDNLDKKLWKTDDWVQSNLNATIATFNGLLTTTTESLEKSVVPFPSEFQKSELGLILESWEAAVDEVETKTKEDQAYDDSKDKYLRVFEQVFVKMEHYEHYKMMMRTPLNSTIATLATS